MIQYLLSFLYSSCIHLHWGKKKHFLNDSKWLTIHFCKETCILQKIIIQELTEQNIDSLIFCASFFEVCNKAVAKPNLTVIWWMWQTLLILFLFLSHRKPCIFRACAIRDQQPNSRLCSDYYAHEFCRRGQIHLQSRHLPLWKLWDCDFPHSVE